MDFGCDVSFLSRHEQMVYRLRSLAPTSIHSFDLVADVTVVIFLSELRGRAIGRASNLRAELIPLFERPRVTQVTNLKMKTTKLLINLQVLDVHIRFHVNLHT
jgi:hypothetical protein